jgi:hypothetical protein
MRLTSASAFIGAVVVAFGCATSEDLEPGTQVGSGGSGAAAGQVGSGGKVDNPNAGGGTAGSAATGGGSGGDESGGSGGISGAAGQSSGGSAGGCAPGEKLCASVCIAPQPGVGCSLTDCTPCPTPPPNSTAQCSSGVCDFACNAGYAKDQGQCVSTGSGGTGGSGGSGGTSGSGGSSGGTGCPQSCDPSAGEQQFICTFLCTFQGKFGLCAPGVNCCVCF